MCKKMFPIQVPIVFVAIAAMVTSASAATTTGSLTFSNTPLVQPNGDSEPAISIGADGTMAITGLPWNRASFDDFATRLWSGPYGATPTFQGVLDAGLTKPGATVLGALDADVDIGSTGRLHATSLLGFVNEAFNLHHPQIGVSAISCPGPGSAGCTAQIIDTTQTDRPWITSDGPRVWISYRDAGQSGVIHVQRSEDDGLTWKKVGDPIVGEAGATANSTYNGVFGPIVSDPSTHNVYSIHTAGQTGINKGRGGNTGTGPGTALYNNVYVSRSTDGGDSWTTSQVASYPLGTQLLNLFPTLAADPTNGKLYAAWSDAQNVWLSASSDQGSHWSTAVAANIAPASTVIFPWLAARGGKVDLVYYGTSAASKDDPNAVWNTYLAQTTDDGASFTQSLVSATPNHVGVVCTEGSACDPSQRTLLDLFEVAINPQNGLAAIIYTDDVLTTDGNGNPLPQIVLAQQSYPSLGATSVPEPASIVLAVAAIIGLPYYRPRRVS